jgi:ketosteroid isomerase-like protein
VELVRRLNEAWKARDADTRSSFVTPDVVHRPIATFTAKEFRGRDATSAFRDEWDEAWAHDFVSQVETIREYGDAVIALVRFSGHRTGTASASSATSASLRSPEVRDGIRERGDRQTRNRRSQPGRCRGLRRGDHSGLRVVPVDLGDRR